MNRFIAYLFAAMTVTACTTTPTTTIRPYDPNEPAIKRYSASKSDLLYGYRIDQGAGDTYGKAKLDADNWCSQHGMVAVERTYPACQEYNYPNNHNVRYCNIAFKCEYRGSGN